MRKKCTSPRRTCGVQLGYPVAPHGFDGSRPGSARSANGDHSRGSLHHGQRRWRRGRASAARRRRRRVSNRRPAGHQRRVRAFRPRDRSPRAGVHELPLVVTAGDSEREDVFRRTGEAYVWHDGAAAARTARSSGDAGAVGRRRRVLRVAVAGSRPDVPAAHRGGMGEDLPRRPARPAVSLGRALRSGHGRISSRSRQTAPGTARRRAAPIRRTATASSTSSATSGSGCRTGTRPTRTRRRSDRTRPVPRMAACGSSAAAAGCRPTCAC